MDKPSTRILTKAYIEDNFKRCKAHRDCFTGEEYDPKTVKIILEDIEEKGKISIDIPTAFKMVLVELDRMAEKFDKIDKKLDGLLKGK